MKILTFVLVFVALAGISGCAATDRVTRYAQEFVDNYYCDLSPLARQTVRQQFNPTPEGNTVEVNCAGAP